MKSIMAIVKDEDGATMVEYALMLALIAAVCIGVVTFLGTSSQAKFDDVGQAIENAPPAVP